MTVQPLDDGVHQWCWCRSHKCRYFGSANTLVAQINGKANGTIQ